MRVPREQHLTAGALNLAVADAPSTERAGPEWDVRIQLLHAVAHAATLVQTLREIEDARRKFEKAAGGIVEEMRRNEILATARFAVLNDDWHLVRSTLRPLLDHDPSAAEAASMRALQSP
jgi:hypothetical protein